MYPPTFDYVAPTTVEEVIGELTSRGEDARILAGGQSLIPMMKLRLAAPGTLVDINGVEGLDQITRENGHLAFGALVRHNDVVKSDAAKASGVVAAAAPWISDPLVRNRGTVCGSVAHCDPEGDWNSVMLAVRASVVVQGSGGQRIVPIDEFVVDFFTNSLEQGEMVIGVQIPVPTGPTGGTYLKLERKVGDYATAAVGVQLELDAQGNIAQAGISLTGVNNINTRASAAEQALSGQAPSDDLFNEAAQLAVAASDPEDNVRGSADYKRNVIKVFTKRALDQALSAAQGS